MNSEAAKKAWATRRNNQGAQPVPPDIVEAADRRIKTKELYKVLKLCSKFVTKREFTSLGFKCFRFEKNVIKVFSKDKGIEYTMPESYDFGNCFVQADVLLETLRSFLEKKTIDVEVKDGKMFLEADGLKAQIDLAEPEEDFNFPKLPVEFKPLPPDFFGAVDQVEFAACQDSASFAKISGIFVDGHVFYATDNLMIAKYVSDLDFDASFVIPYELIKTANKDSVLKGYWINDKFWLKYDNFLVFVNVIEKPMDVQRIKNALETVSKDKPVCEYVQNDVLKALKDIKPMAEGSSKKMTLELEKNKMILIGKNEAGEASKEVECNYSGDPISYVFALDFLMDCIKRSKKFSVDASNGRCKLYFVEGDLELLLISLRD